jgi:hypothetical protein
MPARLVALEEGPDITLDRAMVVVGRHPACDTRLDSLRVSRHHCCMTQESGEVVVRDLGSTNGIRINGQRVEIGRLRPGDELSIAHIRYRLENGQAHEQTIADPGGLGPGGLGGRHDDKPPPAGLGGNLPGPGLGPGPAGPPPPPLPPPPAGDGENALAAAVRKLLPIDLADKARIQVIVQMSDKENGHPGEGTPAAQGHEGAPEQPEECHSDSSH